MATVEVREQVYVDAPLERVVAVLSIRRRGWLRVLTRLAAREAGTGRAGAAVDRLVLGVARRDEASEVRCAFRWRHDPAGEPFRTFDGYLVARADGAGTSLTAIGTCAVREVAHGRSKRPHEVALRSLLGHIRNVIEDSGAGGAPARGER